jgi:lipid II isoglutaminyl synthase (glutamine-hydrolysing)
VRAPHTLRLCALYPDLMNIYADRGNLLLLERRCAWRGIGFRLSACGVGEPLDGDAHDFYYLGGGQDRDQRLCAEDLLALKGQALHEAAARGAVVLGVCGGYQLLGRSYQLGAGDVLEGVGLVDVRTVREAGPRLIGNVAIEVELDDPAGDGEAPGDRATAAAHSGPTEHAHAERAPHGTRAVLAGFENHGGRSYLGAQERPLGSVIKGHGNDGHSGFEGVRRGHVIGTYLHGPLLPKNAWFADWLIAAAIGVAYSELAPLEDELEAQAHSSALRAAGLRGS